MFGVKWILPANNVVAVGTCLKKSIGGKMQAISGALAIGLLRRA